MHDRSLKFVMCTKKTNMTNLLRFEPYVTPQHNTFSSKPFKRHHFNILHGYYILLFKKKSDICFGEPLHAYRVFLHFSVRLQSQYFLKKLFFVLVGVVFILFRK